MLNPKQIDSTISSSNNSNSDNSNNSNKTTLQSYLTHKLNKLKLKYNYKVGKSILYDICSVWGILKSRLIFAEYIPKDQHLLRHKAADLFLDTLVYGAHSTATDALRGVS